MRWSGHIRLQKTIHLWTESCEQYKTYAENDIKADTAYFWKTGDGEYASSCNWHPVEDMASIGMVYTRDEFRCRHYKDRLCVKRKALHHQLTCKESSSSFVI